MQRNVFNDVLFFEMHIQRFRVVFGVDMELMHDVTFIKHHMCHFKAYSSSVFFSPGNVSG